MINFYYLVQLSNFRKNATKFNQKYLRKYMMFFVSRLQGALRLVMSVLSV